VQLVVWIYAQASGPAAITRTPSVQA
jgi:hypothetical protein